MKRVLTGVAALLLGASATTVRASDFDVDLGLGYSRLQLDGNNKDAKDLDHSDSAGLDLAFKWRVPPSTGLRLGIGLTASGYRDEFHVTDPITFDRVHRYRELDLVVPELRIGYNVPIGGNFFIEPSLGVGLAAADYRTGTIHHHHHHHDDEDYTYDDDDNDTFRANLALRPRIQAGVGGDHWKLGLEASYLFTHLDFGNGIGGDVNELYGGAFFRVSF
jgi:hypothetical protein